MEINSGDTAWILASSALVLLMTPGLALFYGGMTRAKSVLNMMMMSFGALGLVTVLWMLYGYSLAFDDDAFGGLVGGLGKIGLKGTLTGVSGTLPETVFASFQLMFAVITVALISGAIADRAKFGAWMIFAGVWATLVYFPVAHWVFAFDGDTTQGGWIANDLQALDFAGGTAVHINAGAAGLALALVLGKRKGWPRESFKPHNLPLVLLGAGLLWFGWFGFNAGSAVAANNTAGIAFINTQVATAAAVLSWLVIEKVRDKHATTLGAASGAVAGLVAITPACGSVNPVGALIIGLLAGAVCALAVGLKYRLGFDDSLDVVGVHLVGGLAGSLLIGLLATDTVVADTNGLFYGGGLGLLGKQAVASFAVLGYSFVVTYIIGFIIKKTIGFRVDEEAEIEGIDTAVHAESAYDFVSGSSLRSGVVGGPAPAGINDQSVREAAPAGKE
ncbi:ammonium transporter [Cryptosporangium aurantiacum]|uniref:Ammonium transporter n=1 Tax=Cryptosporangium aurantiacum TaxID=134849 RepID=A0A1M7HVC9_9ACTN|nr:ammonium transporter [Cryptosporangium aurantiacum]SHM32057.1 ammonium transporter [Cryptosporangium aurantiacum]